MLPCPRLCRNIKMRYHAAMRRVSCVDHSALAVVPAAEHREARAAGAPAVGRRRVRRLQANRRHQRASLAQLHGRNQGMAVADVSASGTAPALLSSLD